MEAKIVTYTGKVFNLLNPTPDTVCIEDIAHSLSQICRYAGHTREFYSVAQHCVLMSLNGDLPGDPMEKLLHDAAEAYIGDIASPWKQILYVGVPVNIYSVKKWEQKIQKVIGLALEVNLEHSAKVKEADKRMYFAEVRDLMPPSPLWKLWCNEDLEPAKTTIIPWNPEFAENCFLDRYYALKQKRD